MFENWFGKLPKGVITGSLVANVPVKVGQEVVNILYFGNILKQKFSVKDSKIQSLGQELILVKILGEVSEENPGGQVGQWMVRTWFSFTLKRVHGGWKVGSYHCWRGNKVTPVADFVGRLVPYVIFQNETPEVWVGLNGNEFLVLVNGTCPPIPLFSYWLERKLTGEPKFYFQDIRV